jgi:hypothetical protein
MRKSLLILFLFAGFHCLISAQDNPSVHIKGYAFDSDEPSKRLDDLMIINQRTGQGIFGMADGSFQLNSLKSDTIVIASSGYEYSRVCFADSALKDEYQMRIQLKRLSVRIEEVTIFSPRDLQEIYNDINKLGYNKADYQLEGIDAISSPITFLYQQFNRLEKQKRINAERVNADKKRKLLKQLLATYVAHDIIDLDDDRFDSFIDYCNVPEEYMKRASQYEFCIYIKNKFEAFRTGR